jgi:hypothetical protein
MAGSSDTLLDLPMKYGPNYHALQSQTDSVIFSAARLPVNRISRKLCKMESFGKYKENETNPDLL